MKSKLDKELASLLYKQAPFVSISLFALLGIALYFFWGELPTHLLLGWTAIVLALCFVLLFMTWLFHRKANVDNAKAWLDGYAYLAMVENVFWGLIGPMSFMVDSEVYRLLTLFMLGGMSAGAIVTRGMVFNVYAISIVALLAPIIITLSIQNTPVADGMMVLTVIYLFFMLSVAKSYSSSIKKNILLWLDNEKLVEQLKHSNVQVEDANKGLTREIEQRRRVEADLLQAKDRAEQASEAKNQFLASVSHELRTPLNGIIGFTSILEKEPLSEEQSGYISQIGKSANALLHIVNDILDITAIEAGHLKLHEEPFSLRTEIAEVVAILNSVAEAKGLGLTATIEPNVHDFLQGDANRLRQIVSNLLSNALKYTNEGQVSLHIYKKTDLEGGALLHFDIEDSGIGIPDNALATLFENFTRVESFETRHTDGVGLGLAIVKNLLHEMGGSISVTSRLGEGSCFSFELPFRLALKQTESEVVATQEMGEQLQRLKVLVVDDNRVNRLVLSTFLESNGIGSVEASSGSEALRLIEGQRFDVVLMDIQMPGISGLEVAERVMAMGKEIPAMIAVTAHAFPEQREVIIKAGFTDLLIKPVSEHALIRTLAQVQAGKRGGHAASRVGI